MASRNDRPSRVLCAVEKLRDDNATHVALSARFKLVIHGLCLADLSDNMVVAQSISLAL